LSRDKLGGELSKNFGVFLERQVGVAVFNPDVLSLDVAKIAKALLERLNETARRRWGPKKADRANIRSLCPGDEGRSSERGDDDNREPAPV
jgi:hypothetical protein